MKGVKKKQRCENCNFGNRFVRKRAELLTDGTKVKHKKYVI